MQLAQQQDEFRKLGVRLAGVSYDSVAALESFSTKSKLSFPLLSDPQAKIIKAFGILNEQYKEGHKWHGIPHPQVYYVDPKGVILGKFHEKRYQDRPAPEKILTYIKAHQAKGADR